MEGPSWPRSYFEYIIGATKDDASVQKKKQTPGSPGGVSETGPWPPARSKVSQQTQQGAAFEGRALRPIGTGPEDGEVCSEIVLSAAA